MKAVLAIEKSANTKLGKGECSATYVSQASCPPSCAFLGQGCYAETGPLGLHTKKLNRSRLRGAENLAREEARAISQLEGLRPLRLHVVGDCRTEAAAAIVATASGAYRRRNGQPVWTYTHAWKWVRRWAWRKVSVLASVESLEGVRRAWNRGYAAALVVGRHPSDGRAKRVDGWRLIPCPAQTRDRTCVSCRLCWDGDALHRRRAVITFEAHGSGQGKVRQASCPETMPFHAGGIGSDGSSTTPLLAAPGLSPIVRKPHHDLRIRSGGVSYRRLHVQFKLGVEHAIVLGHEGGSTSEPTDRTLINVEAVIGVHLVDGARLGIKHPTGMAQ